MEWYDFAVYGFFTGILGRLFFPSDEPVVSLVASFGAFAGFLVRPPGELFSDGSAAWWGGSGRCCSGSWPWRFRPCWWDCCRRSPPSAWWRRFYRW